MWLWLLLFWCVAKVCTFDLIESVHGLLRPLVAEDTSGISNFVLYISCKVDISCRVLWCSGYDTWSTVKQLCCDGLWLTMAQWAHFSGGATPLQVRSCVLNIRGVGSIPTVGFDS